MDFLTSNLSSPVTTQTPVFSLLFLQALNQLQGMKPELAELNKRNACHTELEMLELQIENQKLKSQLLSRDQRITELEHTLERFQHFNEIVENKLEGRILDTRIQDDQRTKKLKTTDTELHSSIERNIRLMTGWIDDMDKEDVNINKCFNSLNMENYSVKQVEDLMRRYKSYANKLKNGVEEQRSLMSQVVLEMEVVENSVRDLKNEYESWKTVLNVVKNELKSELFPEKLKLDPKYERSIQQKELEACKQELYFTKESLAEELGYNNLLYLYYKYNDKYTGLQRACHKCDLEDVKIFVRHTAELKDSGDSVIHMATREGCINIVDWFTRNSSAAGTENKNIINPQCNCLENLRDEKEDSLDNNTLTVNAVSKYYGTPLHVASQYGHLQIIRLLLERGATIDSRMEDQFTPLHVATENNQLDVVRLLLNRSACVNAKSEHLLTPLHLSAKYGYKEVLRILLDSGAVVEAKSSGNFTPLYFALKNEHFQVAQILYEKGALISNMSNNKEALQDIEKILWNSATTGTLEGIKFLNNMGIYTNSRNLSGTTMLHLASEVGELDMMQFLLKAGTNPEVRDESQLTPLHTAAISNHTSVCNLLLDWGADADALDENGNTPLQAAATKGHLSVCNLLLTRGAQVVARDVRKNTPLHKAAFYGHSPVCKLLLDWGTDVNIRDTWGETPIHKASTNGHVTVCRLLLDRRAQIDARDNLNSTPIHQAAFKGHTSVCNLLLDRGSPVDITDSSANTPLHSAAYNGHVDVCRLLLDRGGKVDAYDSLHDTPLHKASANGHSSVVSLLLDRGAQVNSRDKSNKTPLHYAAYNGHTYICRLLLDRGAQIDARDSLNKTPLDYATYHRHYSVCSLLLQRRSQAASLEKNKKSAGIEG